MLRCASCGEQNPERFRHCGYCGATLSAAPAARDTRKTVTVLFTDVTDSTTLGERLDPESLRDVLGRYFASMRQVIERHGGTVEKYIGDAIMAVFGVPVLHEEDALRAVRAATEMRSALERVNVDIRSKRGVALETRTGVNTGPVVVGPGGPGEAIVVGDTVNVAARLQSSAAPGEIVIGEATLQLVRDAVEVGPAEPLELKGKAEPVTAYRLRYVTAGAEGRLRRLDAPMVGRARELELLHRAFDGAAAAHACRRVTIIGAAGVGKSRLVAEFLGALRDRARVVRGRCVSYGEGISYWPIAEIVRQITGIADGDTAHRAAARIGAFVGGLPEAGAIARGLAGIVGLDASVAQKEVTWAFRRALEQVASERPLIVLVDDIHWAEEVLLELLVTMVDLAQGPILLVCPARPELLDDHPDWGGRSVTATTIPLEPLEAGSALELIDALAPGRALPNAVRRRILEAAEGNPLYVEEYLGMLIDDGLLVAEADGWRARGDVGSIAVPPTIQAMLSARLDRLTADERAVAERASVVGRVFERSSVVALSPASDRPDVPGRIEALLRKELIRPDRSGLSQDEAFRFRHLLIRDAAYDRVPKAERAALHERLADWLEVAAGDRLGEVEPLVGYHLEQAFRFRQELGPIDEGGRAIARRAAERLIAAGRRAFERSDTGATANLLGRGAALLEPADPIRVAVLPALGRALNAIGRFDDAVACIDEALERSEAAGDERTLATARVLRCLLDLEPAATPTERRRIADEAAIVFVRLGDDLGQALCWRLRGYASWLDGQAAGEEAAAVRALEHARRADAPREEAIIADAISSDLVQGPTPVPEAIARCEAIRDAAPDDRGIELAMSHALAHLHARLGRFELARSLAARCREIAAESGERASAADMTEVAWDVEMLAGDHEAAARIITEGRDELAALGRASPMHEKFLALSRLAQGRAVDVDRLLEITARESDPVARANTARTVALARAAAGELEQAEVQARSAVEILSPTDFITFRADAEMAHGDVLAAAGRGGDAKAAYHAALVLYVQKGSLVGARLVQARLDRSA